MAMQAASTTVQTESWLIKVAGWKYLILVFRLLLAGMFLLSSIGKLPDIERYSVDVVYDFGVLPMILARPFGLLLPFIELACGLGMLFGVLTRLSAFGVAFMSLAFFIVKGYVLLVEGRNLSCGCFGAVMDTLASFTIYLDIPMLVMGLIVMMAPPASRYFASIGLLLPQGLREKLRYIW